MIDGGGGHHGAVDVNFISSVASPNTPLVKPGPWAQAAA
jgi:hypothetical protein